jgi:hypothetical protein
MMVTHQRFVMVTHQHYRMVTARILEVEGVNIKSQTVFPDRENTV